MRKWITLAFLCGAFFFYMSDRQLFGLLLPLIQNETGLNRVQLGLIDTVMYWVLAMMMPFSGVLGDRLPRARVIAIAIIGWGALTLCTGFAGGIIGFLLLRSIGCTAIQTFYGPSAYALMADEHTTTRTTAMSLHQGAMYTGMLTSGALVSVILASTWFGSWRHVYMIFGAGTVAVGVMFAIFFWNDSRRSTAAQKSLKAGMRAFFLNPAVLCAGAGYIALVFAANAVMSWAPTYIAEKFALDVGTVGKGVMFGPNIAAMVTVLVTGFVTDCLVRRFPRARLAIQIGALVGAAPLFVLFGMTGTIGVIWMLLTFWGVARGLFQANNYPSIFDVVPADVRASAVGFLNFIAYMIGSLAPLLFGWLSHRWGVGGFEWGFAALGGVLVVAALAMALSYLRFFKHYHIKG